MKIFGFLALLFGLILPATAQTLEPETQRQIEIQSAKLRSADVETRRDAVFRLGLLQNAVASRAAAQSLRDSAEIVRATAAKSVIFMLAEEAASYLLPLLSDRSELVRREIAFALGETRSKTATDALIRALQTDRQASVRASAAIALGNIADERAIEPLSQALLAPRTRQNQLIDEFVRRSAARSLGKIRHKSAAPALIAALRDVTNEDDIRREAATALGLIADKSAIEALQENLKAEDYYLAEISARSLRLINSNQTKN